MALKSTLLNIGSEVQQQKKPRQPSFDIKAQKKGQPHRVYQGVIETMVGMLGV